MAMRRPRIKPVANIQLNCKRKTKSVNDVKIRKVVADVYGVQEIEKQVDILATHGDKSSKSIESASEARVENSLNTTANENNLNNGTDENKDKGTDLAVEHDGKSENNVIEMTNEYLEKITIENNDLIHNTKEQRSINACEDATERLNDSDAFKCPPKVGYQRLISHTSNSGIDDVFYSDIEEGALQMDLEKPPSNNTMSPSKNLTRQRIRPTPHFGQRRNSLVGSSPPHTTGNEETNLTTSTVINDFVPTAQIRREKHHSVSFTGNTHSSHHHHTPHKYLPTGVTNTSISRIRTESGCSVFSDTNTSSHKSRKTEDHKQNPRKDFESRFFNGVPEKSAIKMADLIYYNPVTNPMEQKPNPSVKLEQTENSSSDFKPFTEMPTKDKGTDADTEAAPVPQLKLNAKGELILDDKSLVIETTAEQEARKVLANSSLIYLDENTGMNGFYSRKKRTREWIASETIKFYRCLQNIGTDFSLMVSLFPNRTRRDLKLKFKKEERKNSHLINKALLYPKQFDIEALKAQMNEEEKQREEQAKATKEKCKESKKRKVSNISKAKRVLINEDVYQNENEQKTTKKTRKTKKNEDKSEDIVQNKKKYQVENEQKLNKICKINKDIVQNDNETISSQNDSVEADKSQKVVHKKIEQRVKRKIKNLKRLNKGHVIVKNNSIENGDCVIQANHNVNVTKRRRRRKRTPKKLHREEIILKEEIIKVENKQEYSQTSKETEYQNTKQLQTEINELLDSDLDTHYNTAYENSIANVFPITSQVGQYNKHVNTPSCPNENDENCIAVASGMKYIFANDCNSAVKDDVNCISTSSATELYSPLTRSPSPPSAAQSLCSIENETESLESTKPEPDIMNNDTCSSVISERELNEDDIQSILTELAEGSLVLVSTLDPDDPDKVLNEIYMMDNNTGDLCEEPLNIPDNIVQCILTVVS